MKLDPKTNAGCVGVCATRLLFGLIFLVVPFVPIALTGCDLNTSATNKFFSGLYVDAAEAIDSHDAARMASALKGLDLDAPGREHMTLMWYAIQKKNYQAIQTLVRAGSRIDEQAVENLGTPLQFALMDKDLQLLSAMLDGGLSPDWQDADGANLLQLAMKSDHAFDVVKLLVARHANVNQRDGIGGSALDEAVDTMQPDIATNIPLDPGKMLMKGSTLQAAGETEQAAAKQDVFGQPQSAAELSQGGSRSSERAQTQSTFQSSK